MDKEEGQQQGEGAQQEQQTPAPAAPAAPASASSSSALPLMSLNDGKAGMAGLDKDRINAIIQEASKGSKFYSAKEKAQARIDRQVQDMKRSVDRLSRAEVDRATRQADTAAADLRASRDLSRTIVHVDMDAFYAAVEMRDDPSLRDRPMAVGGIGMLSTSNYAARRFGVRAGMPGFIGKKLCPDLVLVELNFDKYRAVSKVVRGVFAEYDPNFSPMSLDEAYLDITDYLSARPGTGAEAVVKELRGKIEERTRLTASAGIAPNTMLAKVCSDKDKPNGQYYLRPDLDTVMDFVTNLPIRKVSGIGNVTEQLLGAVDVKTCGDLWEKRGYLKLLFSDISFSNFLRISLGVASTHLSNWSERDRKSLSTETTFRDTSEFDELSDKCRALSAELAEDLQKHGLQGKAVTLKIKTHRFQIKTKVSNIRHYSDDAAVIESAALSILRHFADSAEEKPLRLRLMGVRMSEFRHEAEEAADGKQRTLESFLRQKTSSTYECPVCRAEVEAKSEFAFNRQHLEKCLERGGGNVASDASESFSESSRERPRNGHVGEEDKKVVGLEREGAEGEDSFSDSSFLAEMTKDTATRREKGNGAHFREEVTRKAWGRGSHKTDTEAYFLSSLSTLFYFGWVNRVLEESSRKRDSSKLKAAADGERRGRRPPNGACMEGGEEAGGLRSAGQGRNSAVSVGPSCHGEVASSSFVPLAGARAVSSSSGAEGVTSTVSCPVCSKEVEGDINRHLDECLSVQEIRKSSVSDAFSWPKRKSEEVCTGNNSRSSLPAKRRKDGVADISNFFSKKR